MRDGRKHVAQAPPPYTTLLYSHSAPNHLPQDANQGIFSALGGSVGQAAANVPRSNLSQCAWYCCQKIQ